MGISDYLYSEFDSDIVEEFLMLLDVLEDNMDLTIESLYQDSESLNDLFRMFHNLKSASGFLKLKRIQIFAHFVEDILQEARDKNKITEELIDWLFKVSNQFHIWYRNITNNEELAPLQKEIFKILKL
ncbi:MAG: Hpt domain-containing protein [Nautiliaceae bacterium]